MAVSRPEIIQVFRDRISKGNRLRLSKVELTDLIAGFVDLLTRTESAEKIQVLCDAEINLLEEGYPQASVAKYLTRYRKVITAAIEDGTLELTEQNSHRYVHQQRVTGIREERLEHWALTYLKYSPEVYETIDKRSQLTNRDKQLNLRLVPVDQYLELLYSFLEKKGQFEARWLATAIAGVTGRRFAEVLAKGTFSLTEHPYLLRFEGQLKSRAGHGEGYDIVTLFPAVTVLEALQRLRQLPAIRAIAKLQGSELSTALNAFNQKLNAITSKHLMAVVPPLEGKKRVSVHNLRSLYGAIAVYFFCPELQHEYAFVQHFLGHVMDSPATGHYFRFALCDNQGTMIRDKGILLDEVKPLSIEKQSEQSRAAVDNITPVEMADQKAAVSNDQRTQLMSTSPNPDNLPHHWLAHIDERIANLKQEFEAKLLETQQQSRASWLIQRVEALEAENKTLKTERDQAIATLEALDTTAIDQLKSENETLAQELKIAQDTLNGFRELLMGHTTQPKGPKSEPPQPEQNPPTTQTLHPKTATETQKQATPNASSSPKKGKAFKRAEAIFLAIKDWNEQNPTESFAINPGILETIFKVHRQAAKDFFNTYQNELWEYHQEIGVASPRWHNRGKDTAQLKAFVTAALSQA